MAVTGLDFVALQVRDVEQSATFYEKQLGLTRAPFAPPGAVVFTTTPIPFAVREPLPGVDLTSRSSELLKVSRAEIPYSCARASTSRAVCRLQPVRPPPHRQSAGAP